MTSLSPSEVITTPLMRPLSTFAVTVLLIDDQEIIGEKVRSMLADESDIAFHYCKDPSLALEIASEVSPTVILQDLVMPDIDGLELTRYFRANEKTKDVPLIVLSTTEDPSVKAEAFSLGANDYIVKLPDKRELVARIRYHSNAYIRLLERNEAYEKLTESQNILNQELAEAAEYVRSLLPPPVKGPPIDADWQFIPSTQLGGDAFGYHWLDKDHLVIFLLDVCGHGVGAALLSITVMNVLRAQSLSNTDFHDPVAVLTALNDVFPMEKQNNMFFTMWYGVWNATTRQLKYATAGHPPALLFTRDDPPKQLATEGLVVGAASNVTFTSASCNVAAGSQLYVFSDGVYEITQKNNTMLHLDDFIKILQEAGKSPKHAIETVHEKILTLSKSPLLADDYSLLQVVFY